MEDKKIREFVMERYSKIANNEENSIECSCCGSTKENSIIEQAQAAGYTIEEIKSIPSEAVFGLGCGNPTALAGINLGEVVLDLGSGGGIDVFLAANKVGEDGKVIGVDMTPEMIETAIKNAKVGGYTNVEFKQGEIENLPVEDNSIDLIISNCVINLTPHKYRAYSEAFRVLKPNGRILVSDIVTDGEIPSDIRKNFQAWAGCVAGALDKQDYIDTIKKAGFNNINVVSEKVFTEPDMDVRLVGKIISQQIKAIKKCECGETIESINETRKDSGCGCGSESAKELIGNETNDDSGCGCGGIDYPDMSLVKNPDNPSFFATKEFIQNLEEYAHSLGILSVGYTLITPDLLIHDKFIQYPFTVVLTMEMNEDIMNTPPGEDAKDLNDTAYVKLGILTTKISDYLRKNGFATEIAHPYGGLVKFSQLGQKASLGCIGQSGLLISPELGPRQKISAIFVSIANLPMKGSNEHLWIADYCEKCGKCIKACPEKALIENETCCGEKETEFVHELCIGCSEGCTYCIEGCPFNEKEYTHIKERFDKMNLKLSSKQ
jgi:ubiquinone/menaquinone biosynthesis C-methylase UbiE/ferredoxin